ncbi:MAG: hypothetical protein Q8N43_01655 [Candidatus Azambacteria bacterium]|nr:hypothetical protein [Candidatus Azambacteria bacterium]
MLITSLLGLIIIFTANIVFGMRYGFGFRHYWFFELLHFWGGFFVAMFLANFINSYILIFVGLTIVSFLWEISEYLIGRNSKLSGGIKKTFGLKDNVNLQPKWQDTILDVILNFAGATVFVYFAL